MAIDFKSYDPSGLLKAFKKAIDDKHVVTWAYDSSGDFYHTPPQWSGKGWLRPHVYAGRLTMTFLGRASQITEWSDYAVLQGRFIEAMISHCHDRFTTAEVSANPMASDGITSRVA